MRSQREDHGVARRANAILLLDDGKSCQAIAEFLYIDDDTIRGWYKAYRIGGWDALSTDGWKGGQSRMTSAQKAELCVWLDGRFCRSTVEIRAHIEAQFSLVYSTRAASSSCPDWGLSIGNRKASRAFHPPKSKPNLSTSMIAC